MADLVRGAVVLFAGRGDYTSKPRPGVVVQHSATLADGPSITLCGITTSIVPEGEVRILLAPTQQNGLRDSSQVMVDKIATIRRERIREIIGRVAEDDLLLIDEALRRWLDL